MEHRNEQGMNDAGATAGGPSSEDAFQRGAGAAGAESGAARSAAAAEDRGGAAAGGGPTDDDAGSAGGGADAVADAAAEPTLQRQLEDQRDRYLRLAAEYDNFRKRSAKERAELGTRAQAELVRHFIDALDDLSRFAHLDPAATDAATVVEGVAMVEKKMLKALAAAGLEVISPVDQAFDPSLHEAVMTEPALSPEDDHMVARVFQPGYVFNGQLVRPARVVVKQWNG